jgi:hypothetical protein
MYRVLKDGYLLTFTIIHLRHLLEAPGPFYLVPSRGESRPVLGLHNATMQVVLLPSRFNSGKYMYV